MNRKVCAHTNKQPRLIIITQNETITNNVKNKINSSNLNYVSNSAKTCIHRYVLCCVLGVIPQENSGAELFIKERLQILDLHLNILIMFESS